MKNQNYLWHPNTQMSEWNQFTKIVQGRGMWLIDEDGNRLLDGVASMWCNVWGHSKNELVNAIKLINEKKMKISESSIAQSLYTKGIPNPDILIRTGNTNRLSNFLLWQTAYAEIFFVKKLWPDFTSKDFNKILLKFEKTKRNFGKI